MITVEKLDLLMLGKEERRKAEDKFLASLALVSEEELREVTEYLNSEGVQITKAKDIKVVVNSKDEIAKKFSILNEIHETDVYRQDPSRINRNVIDVYKRIQYCKQIGKSYKKEDGTYEAFLFNEMLWQQMMVKENDNVRETTSFVPVEEEIVTLEPVVEPIINEEVIETEEAPEKFMDIKEYMAANKDLDELTEKTTDFSTIRKELEGQLAELDALRNSSFDEISFGDIEPESYGMGRAA